MVVGDVNIRVVSSSGRISGFHLRVANMTAAVRCVGSGTCDFLVVRAGAVSASSVGFWDSSITVESTVAGATNVTTLAALATAILSLFESTRYAATIAGLTSMAVSLVVVILNVISTVLNQQLPSIKARVLAARRRWENIHADYLGV